MFKLILLSLALWSNTGFSAATRIVNADQIVSADTTKVYTLPSSTSTLARNDLTGFTSGAGTITSGDSPLTAIQKLDANYTPTTSAIAALAVDWSILRKSGGLYTKTLSANSTFTFSNQAAGQSINILITNTASNFTVTWPTVKWSGGSAPTQTIGAKSDLYSFIFDGTNIYGSVVQNF